MGRTQPSLNQTRKAAALPAAEDLPGSLLHQADHLPVATFAQNVTEVTFLTGGALRWWWLQAHSNVLVFQQVAQLQSGGFVFTIASRCYDSATE